MADFPRRHLQGEMDDDTPRSEPETDVSAPNAHACVAITANISDTSASDMMVHDSPGRADLDSHANKVVLGNSCFVLRESGKSVDVNAFVPEYANLKKVPVVNAAILYYESPYNGHQWILVYKNAFHVPTMSHHLIPPFVMREAGAVVNDKAKIHTKEPTTRDHGICFDLVELQIPLCLSGIFLYFPCQTPTMEELTNAGDGRILLATPDGPWDPHSDHYVQNEEHMLDFAAGQMIPEDQQQQQVVLDDLQEEETMVSSTTISAAEHALVDEACCSRNNQVHTFDVNVDNEAAGADCVSSQLDEAMAHLVLSLSPTLVTEVFAARLVANRDIGHFGAKIGATDAWTNNVLFPKIEEDLSTVDIGSLNFDHLFQAKVSSSFASMTKGVEPSHLAKVWRIDHATAKRTIDVTSQLQKRPMLDTLNQTTLRMIVCYATNALMNISSWTPSLQPRRQTSQLEVTHACNCLYLTNLSLMLSPMKSKSEVPAALKLFAKEVGAPDAIIADAAGEQTSRKVKTFLQQIGTSLRVLGSTTSLR
jgi:hypothetical protein